jgi:ABC-2 type transport system permease protein
MNIYLHELKANRKFALTWLIILLSVAALMIFMYISIGKDIDVFKKILSNYPPSLRNAFGINIDLLGSALGYYSSFVLTIVVVSSAIESMILGLSILSKEIREKTADFLYSKPITRNQIITSKILASITLLVSSNIIYVIGLFFVLLSVSTVAFDLGTFMLLAFIPLFVQLIFFSLGIFVSAAMSKIKAVLPISMGIVFGFYMLNTFADEKLRIINPFKYFDAKYILNNSKYEFEYIILTFSIITILTALTYIIYRKKDIHSV